MFVPTLPRDERKPGDLEGHRAYIRSRIPLHPGALIAGATEANIVVLIARRVVQIEREHTRVAGIIPIATALKRGQFSLIKPYQINVVLFKISPLICTASSQIESFLFH